jgi:hypothetical protein
MYKSILGLIARLGLMSVALFCILSSVVIVGKASDPTAWAQCGSDSYVDCSGGVRCTSTDDVGCKCYSSTGRIVSRHSCAYASQ